MTAHCQPLPKNIADGMLQLVAHAICDRPGENPAQCQSRTNQMVHSALGFAPRDGLELMLASIVIGHFNLILDSARDVFQGQTDQLKARTKTTIVALDRAMLGMLKELRKEGRRPFVEAVGDAQHDAAIMHLDAETATPDLRMPDNMPTTGLPVAAAARESPQAAPNMAPPSISEAVSPQPCDTGPERMAQAPQQAARVPGNRFSRVTPGPDVPEWTEQYETALIEPIAANEALLIAIHESNAEAWRTHQSEEASAIGD
jgi:hypothetical protein